MPKYPVYFNKEEDELLAKVCDAEGCKPYTLMKSMVMELAEQLKGEKNIEKERIEGDNQGSNEGDDEIPIELDD